MGVGVPMSMAAVIPVMTAMEEPHRDQCAESNRPEPEENLIDKQRFTKLHGLVRDGVS
jgi:hypothetical protein